MSEENDLGPPLEPTGEQQVAGNEAFLASCRAALDDIPITREWKLGPDLLTRTDRWGLVWRADFELPGESLAPLINRLVCWQKEGGDLTLEFAIGQSVSPLEAKERGPAS